MGGSPGAALGGVPPLILHAIRGGAPPGYKPGMRWRDPVRDAEPLKEVRKMESNGKEIALTTLGQLGNYGKMKTMIGMRDIVYDADGTVSFKFSGCRKANTCTIHVNSLDLYDITFFRAGTGKISWSANGTVLIPDEKEIEKFTDLYNDQLRETFESFTGLKLSL